MELNSHQIDTSDTTQTLAQARYIELIHKLGKELAYATGWRGKVAEKLGVSLSLISQILKGRRVTRSTIEKAMQSLGLPAEYFGGTEAVQAAPHSIPPTLPPIVDPLLILEAFQALPSDTRKRLLTLIQIGEMSAYKPH